ncbi:MAG: hypothetical protein R3B45_04155 [Bdellovibrionota bacterium]
MLLLISRINFALTLSVLLFSLSSRAVIAKPMNGGTFGLGLIVGTPHAGISMKNWIGPTTAIDAALSWSHDWVHIHGDYLIHDPSLIQVSKGKMPVYYGVGAELENFHREMISVRVPVGIAYEVANHPIEVFVEVVPKVVLVPASSFDIDLGIGGRFYF